jgi:AcrR family transcriptional regulator
MKRTRKSASRSPASGPHAPLPARQERSRRSLEKLLDAAERVLSEEGLEAATVPNIARRAGLSPGTVYRRFPDKDALIRAVVSRFHRRNFDLSCQKLNPEYWRGTTLAQKVHIIVSNMIAAHQRQAGLLRSLFRFAQQHPDVVFRRRAIAMEVRVFEGIVDLFMENRDEVHHPDPRTALTVALMMMVFALRELYVIPTGKVRFDSVFPGFTASAEKELPRVFLRYVGAPNADEPAPPHPALRSPR